MVNAEGHVTYVQIVEISPADESYGFAEAATKVALGVRFENPQRQQRHVKFRVKFALSDKHQGDAPNLESPRPAGGSLTATGSRYAACLARRARPTFTRTASA